MKKVWNFNMDEDFINEVKSIGLLLLSKLKENDYSIVEGNELQIEEDLNTDGVGFKDSRNYNHHQVINNYNMH